MMHNCSYIRITLLIYNALRLNETSKGPQPQPVVYSRIKLERGQPAELPRLVVSLVQSELLKVERMSAGRPWLRLELIGRASKRPR